MITWLILALSMCLLGLAVRCVCCHSCVIFSDNFNRANSSSLGGPWIEHAGEFEVLGQSLMLTVPVPGAAAHNEATVTVPPPTFPNVNPCYSVSCRFLSVVSTDVVGVIVSRQASPASRALVLITPTTLRISSGSFITPPAPVAAPTNVWHTLVVCMHATAGSNAVLRGITAYLNGQMVATLDTTDRLGTINGVPGTRVGGPYATNVVGLPQWDDFRIERNRSQFVAGYEECPDCFTCELTGFVDGFSAWDGRWNGAANQFDTATGWHVTGGRMRAPHFLVGAFRDFLRRCLYLPIGASVGIQFSVASDVHWTIASGTVNAVGIGVQFQAGGGTVSLEAVLDNSGGPIVGHFAFSSPSGSGTIAITPADGDRIAIRITKPAFALLHTVEFLINGTVEHTQVGVALSTSDEFRVDVHLRSLPRGGFTDHNEWDNFEVTMV